MRGIEFVRAASRNRALMAKLSLAFSFVSGAAAGAALAMKYFEKEYAELATMEIQEARTYFTINAESYTPLEKIVEEALPEIPQRQVEFDTDENGEDLERASEIVQDYTSHYTRRAPEPEKEDRPSDIFAGHTATDTIEQDDVDSRDAEYPYIISHEEFMANDPDHNQIQLSYYEKDDVLADDRDIPVEDPDDTVGPEALSKFGYGSKEPETVYVRNERLDSDFEIVRSMGSFAEEVHGLRHGRDSDRILKMRPERD